MKSPDDVREAIERRLQRSWHQDASSLGSNWPHDVALGQIPTASLNADFAAVQQEVHALRQWAVTNRIEVRDGNRRAHGTTQPVPTHLIVPNIDIAASVCGAEWTRRVSRGRQRATILSNRYPRCMQIESVVRSVDGYTDVDFELLLTVTDWFRSNTVAGLTPRQVPIPGVHAKWLNTHRPVIETLTGDRLDLSDRHPARINFTYLDPDYLASGYRRFDSATVGDVAALSYEPDVVIITENKDTAIHFPPTPGGIAVEGAGFGGSTTAAFDWIVKAPIVAYWGDIDAAGFEILDGFRGAGIQAISILMDLETYRTYALLGTHHLPNGQAIKSRTPKPLAHLSDEERSTYHAVCAPRDGLPPRIEQERIPLEVARRALMAAKRTS